MVLDDVSDTSHQEEVFRDAPRSPRAEARPPLPTFLDESVIVEDTLPAMNREVSLPAPVGVEDDQELIVIEDDSVIDDNNLRDGDDRE